MNLEKSDFSERRVIKPILKISFLVREIVACADLGGGSFAMIPPTNANSHRLDSIFDCKLEGGSNPIRFY